ncbi:hypothetical protein F2Q70_00037636 [Brassica cretica]|uniref:non-specific serine/threonine protein kinase n=1 Tax=Brassica cretica TaxID=69181 RepID=A0A8S9JRQ0_BRACR|nr:hypothetical protein F2Q70_00037636 [Brassica cretica]
MNCFSCLYFHEKKNAPKDSDNSRRRNGELTGRDNNKTHPENPKPNKTGNEQNKNDDANKEVTNNIAAKTFTFRELATATKNFRQECLIGEGGFGRVYKGKIEKCDKIVAVKQLDRNGQQGNKEFIVEVLMLSLLHHKHLVNLIGYCADGDQRLLVYEYMSRGSLEDHLLGLLDNVLSDYLWAKAVLLTTTTVATAGLTIQVPLAAIVDSLSGNKPSFTDYIGAAAVMVGFAGINIPSESKETAIELESETVVS